MADWEYELEQERRSHERSEDKLILEIAALRAEIDKLQNQIEQLSRKSDIIAYCDVCGYGN